MAISVRNARTERDEDVWIVESGEESRVEKLKNLLT